MKKVATLPPPPLSMPFGVTTKLLADQSERITPAASARPAVRRRAEEDAGGESVKERKALFDRRHRTIAIIFHQPVGAFDN